jgi:hypothetical protein
MSELDNIILVPDRDKIGSVDKLKTMDSDEIERLIRDAVNELNCSRQCRLLLSFWSRHVQWNTRNAGFSDRVISISVIGSPRERNKLSASILSRSSKAS